MPALKTSGLDVVATSRVEASHKGDADISDRLLLSQARHAEVLYDLEVNSALRMCERILWITEYVIGCDWSNGSRVAMCELRPLT